jgi:hypothetical protein
MMARLFLADVALNDCHSYCSQLLGRNNGMAQFANKSNSNFPFQECVVSKKGQATSTADHLFLRPGENRLDKHPQNRDAINGYETGMLLITSWPKDGYYTANKRSTDHGPRDIGPVVPIV